MFDLFLALSFSTLFLVVSWRQSSIVFLSVPMFLSLYFFVSCAVFSFGHNTPVIVFDPNAFDQYIKVLFFINLYWIAALLGMRVGVLCWHSTIVDSKSFKPQKLSYGRVGFGGRSNIPLEVTKLLFCLLPGLFILQSTSFEEFMSRDNFTAEFTNQRMMVVADTLFWVSAFLAPFIKLPAVRYFALCCLVLSFAAMGERQAPVALFLFVAIERFVLNRGNLYGHIVILVLMFYILMVLISMRPFRAGGLEQFFIFATNPSFFTAENLFFALNYMTNFSVFVNSIGVSAFEVDSRSFFYGINPVPSFINNDTDYFITQHSIRHYVPLPGFSVLISFLGVPLLVLFVFVLFFALEIPRRFLRAKGDILDRIAYYSMTFVPFLFSLQYNLRAASRLFYFLLFAYMVFLVLRRFRVKF